MKKIYITPTVECHTIAPTTLMAASPSDPTTPTGPSSWEYDDGTTTGGNIGDKGGIGTDNGSDESFAKRNYNVWDDEL